MTAVTPATAINEIGKHFNSFYNIKTVAAATPTSMASTTTENGKISILLI